MYGKSGFDLLRVRELNSGQIHKLGTKARGLMPARVLTEVAEDPFFERPSQVAACRSHDFPLHSDEGGRPSHLARASGIGDESASQ
jgi:hypothetical protein